MSTEVEVDVLPEVQPPNWPKDQAVLPKGRPKGVADRRTSDARKWAGKFVDDPRWEKMIWFWIENPEMMPAGVFATLLYYRFGKPAQTIKVKGEIMARPYLGASPEELALKARELADRLAKLQDPTQNAKLVGGGEGA